MVSPPVGSGGGLPDVGRWVMSGANAPNTAGAGSSPDSGRPRLAPCGSAVLAVLDIEKKLPISRLMNVSVGANDSVFDAYETLIRAGSSGIGWRLESATATIEPGGPWGVVVPDRLPLQVDAG